MTTADVIAILAPYVVPIAWTFLTTLGGWVLAEAGRWLRRRTRSDAAVWALERITQTAATVVADIEQRVVPLYREAAADGRLDKSDQAELRRHAIARIKTILGPEVQKQARVAVADLDALILSKIEAAVRARKLRYAQRPGA
jgi:hypothetical protein